jgi:hypothetical protein
MGQGGYGQQYGQPAPDSGRPHSSQPTGGWPYVESAPTPPPRKTRKGLIIGLIVAAVVLVVGIGGYVGWSLTTQGSEFEVGTCVTQEGNAATVVDCGTEGAFRITAIEDTDATCPDPNQPTLLLTGPMGSRSYACLEPTTGQ